MLNVPRLDDLSYEKLFERARSRIPLLTSEWTDFNHHDPGITTLQAFSWLVDTLNYYIDATGEEHRLKYLQLLGLVPTQSSANCLMALSAPNGDIAVARGARFSAGGIPFEASESYRGTAGDMCALLQETDGVFVDLTRFAGVDGEYATIFSYDKDLTPTVYIGFTHALSGAVRLYADVYSNPARNPFSDLFTLSQMCWEYYDGTHWQEAALDSDETCGFLKSGFIALSLDSETAPNDNHPLLPTCHYLRVSLISNEYDVLPQIGKIYKNCVHSVQAQTYAQTLELEYQGEKALWIDYHIEPDDLICVLVQDGEGYSMWYEHSPDADALCAVEAGNEPWNRRIYFDEKIYGVAPQPGSKILVTVAKADTYEKMILGTTTGYASARMRIDIENLHELRLALMQEKDGRPYYTLWDECDNISEADYDANVFACRRAAGEIVFGNGINGAQPESGQLVLAVTAKSSLLENGNARTGQVNHFVSSYATALTVHNPMPAQGGKRLKTSEELEQEIEEKIYKTTRAVTTQDYSDIVKATPGLMIDMVNVISSREYARYYGGEIRQNTVLLAVKPYAPHDSRPLLSETYRKRIRANIEQYRLLTTNIQVLPAKYTAVEINGRIVLTENTAFTRAQVEEKLRVLVDLAHTRKFGADIIYGRVFSHLEMLDCVVKVEQLTFSCMGSHAHKNEQGDIVIYPDALAWLQTVNIEYV